MPTIEELLRASLKGATEKFDKANSALHATVTEAAKAVESVSGGKATLRLVEGAKDEDATRYELYLKAGKQWRKLAIFVVTKEGYPILRRQDAGPDEQFDSAEKLAAYFQNLASDSTSPLVAYLAYIIRNPPEEK